MSFLHRFLGTENSGSKFNDDAGLPTKSRIVAGTNCDSQLKECMATCDKIDQDCVQTCGTAYQMCRESI